MSKRIFIAVSMLVLAVMASQVMAAEVEEFALVQHADAARYDCFVVEDRSGNTVTEASMLARAKAFFAKKGDARVNQLCLVHQVGVSVESMVVDAKVARVESRVASLTASMADLQAQLKSNSISDATRLTILAQLELIEHKLSVAKELSNKLKVKAMATTVKGLQSRLAKARARLAALLKRGVAGKDDDLMAAKEVVKALEAKLKEAKSRLQRRRQNARAALVAQLKVNEQHIKDRLKTLQSQLTPSQPLKDEVASIQKHLKSLRAHLTDAQTAVKVHTSLHSVNEKIAELMNKLRAGVADNNAEFKLIPAKEREAIQKMLVKLKLKQQKLRLRVQRLQAKHAARTGVQARLTQAIKHRVSLAKKIAVLKTMTLSAKSNEKKQSLQTAIDALEAQFASLKPRIARLKLKREQRKVRGLKYKLKQIQAKLNKMKKQGLGKPSAAKKIAALQNRIKSLRSRLTLAKKITTSTRQYVKLTRRVMGLSRQAWLARQNKQGKGLKIKTASSNTNKNKKVRGNAEFRLKAIKYDEKTLAEKLAAAKVQLATASKKMNALKSTQRKRRLAVWKKKLAKLTAQLAAAKSKQQKQAKLAKRVKLMKRKLNAMTRLDKQYKTIADLKARFASAKSGSPARLALRTKLVQAEQRLQSLKKQVKKLQKLMKKPTVRGLMTKRQRLIKQMVSKKVQLARLQAEEKKFQQTHRHRQQQSAVKKAASKSTRRR